MVFPRLRAGLHSLFIALVLPLLSLQARAEDPSKVCNYQFSTLAAEVAPFSEIEKVVHELGAAKIGDYGGDSKKLEEAMRKFLALLDEVNFVNKEEFPDWKNTYWTWWDAHKGDLTKAEFLETWKGVPLDALVARVWMQALEEVATKNKPHPLLKWLPSYLQNERAKKVLEGSTAAVKYVALGLSSRASSTAKFLVSTAIVGSFLNPVLGPVKNWVGYRGQKVTNPVAEKVSQILPTPEGGEAAAQGAPQPLPTLEGLKGSLAMTGAGITSPADFQRRLEAFNQEWLERSASLPGTASARSLTQDFQRDIAVYQLSGETFRLGVKEAVEVLDKDSRKKGRSGRDAAAVFLGELLRLQAREVLGLEAMAGQVSRRGEILAALRAKGLSRERIDELLSRETEFLYSQRRLATSLSEGGLAKALPPELGRLLGGEGDRAWAEANWARDREFFQNKYRDRMAKALDELIASAKRGQGQK